MQHKIRCIPITCFTINTSEKAFTFTFPFFDIIQSVAWAVLGTKVCDIYFIGDATVRPRVTFVADALAKDTDTITRTIRQKTINCIPKWNEEKDEG